MSPYTRYLCPACHQRRTLQSARWIGYHVCLPVPHRQFVFTIPKLLRPIFRKRRHLLTHLFHTATTCLRDAFRTVLDLPDGRLAAAAAVHTFGDYLVFHPHLHVLAAHGRFDDQGRFHCLPDHCLAQLTELFRHQFLHDLHEAKLVSDHLLRIPPPEKATARAMRPLWRDLIQTVWAVDPLQCPHCHGALRPVETLTRPEAIEFFLRLHGLWEGLVNIPPPPDPPFGLDTFEPIDPPWPAIREWIPADDTDPQAVFPEDIVSTHWVPKEIRLDDDRTLVLDPT